MQAYAPSGAEIIGTKELTPGCCGVNFTRGPDGSVTYEHDGTGTTLFWDDQITVQRDGKVVFIDREGVEWTLDQLRFEDTE